LSGTRSNDTEIDMKKIAGLALLALAACGTGPDAGTYDLVIRGGRIVDGTGAAGFEGDLAVRGDRIVAVGRVEGAGRREIDARGLVVAPGFIDMHSHSDLLLLEDGDAQSKIRQGVTTDVLGEDSSGGPIVGKHPREGKTHWTTLGGYFTALEKSRLSINVASYVGQGTIWRCVMGDSHERPTPAQFAEMKELIDQAMKEGASGLSSMLAVPPGLLATREDMIELCKPVAKHGGIYSTHIRNEGTDVLEAIREAVAIGEGAGCGVDIIHLKIAEQKLWGRMGEIVEIIEAARKRGVNVQANVYPYTRGNNNLASILPPWAHEGGTERVLARLRDPAERSKMKRDIVGGIAGWYNHYTAVGGDWKRMLVNGNLTEKNRSFEGKTVDLIFAAKWPRKDGLESLFDFLLEENGSIPTIYEHHTEADMNLAMKQPWTSIGSDGSAYAVEGPLRRGKPHPRNFGTFPRVLGVYARERKLLTLEDAVRKMTSLNAQKIGLKDRGVLRVGAFADLTLFDPAKVIDKSTYLEPFAYNEGIDTVIVNGEVVLDRGARHTGARPGRVLRHNR
jgi:N-acyl-D-aspartate/D-glutamate deacylase